MNSEIAPRNEEKGLKNMRLFLVFSACMMVLITIYVLSSVQVKFGDFFYSLNSVPTVKISEDTPTAGVGGGGIIEIKIPKKSAYLPEMFEENDEEDQLEVSDVQNIVQSITYDMDIGKPSGISKDDFVWAMKNCEYDRNGILGDCAEVIWQECQERELNEFIICGIVAGESLWCDSELAWSRKNVMSIKKNNGDYKYYSTYKECILDGIRLIDEEYISKDGKHYTGGKLSKIASVYAESPNWANHVSECAEMCTRVLQEREIKEA